MSLLSQVPKQVLAAIGDASLDVASAAAEASELILSNAYAPSNKEEATLGIITAISMLFSHALRLQLDKNAFTELLSGTVLATSRAEALVEAYSKLLEQTGAASSALKAHQELAFHRLMDGPLRRITGMKWTMGHRLGNRAMDPPERSVPIFHFTFTTAEGSTIEVSATQEQAQELLYTFKDMVKEGERLI